MMFLLLLGGACNDNDHVLVASLGGAARGRSVSFWLSPASECHNQQRRRQAVGAKARTTKRANTKKKGGSTHTKKKIQSNQATGANNKQPQPTASVQEAHRDSFLAPSPSAAYDLLHALYQYILQRISTKDVLLSTPPAFRYMSSRPRRSLPCATTEVAAAAVRRRGPCCCRCCCSLRPSSLARRRRTTTSSLLSLLLLQLLLSLLLLASEAMSTASSGPPPASGTETATTRTRVFVSGAGGQTGQHVFRKLLARGDRFEPVGIVRTEASRKALLESNGGGSIPEGSVVVCDVTDPNACLEAMKGCGAAVICTSAKPQPVEGKVDPNTGRPVFGYPNGSPRVVDWIGQKNQIDAAAAQGSDVHVVLCSSMGGTNPNHPLNNLGKDENGSGEGDILKWKRKSELYLATQSGLPYTIVHPGGLLNEPGGRRKLYVGVDDRVEGCDNNSVPREDVAEVLVQALLHPSEYRNRSFDLVSEKPSAVEAGGAAPAAVETDFAALLSTLQGKNCDYSLGEVAEE